ncbi:c-type cytochrome [Jiella sp. M17.18]|uniref:c-type cytochrome n=1 Tax=Jiella sp. M17.18 TaxID=3234247 RepID=UPI0034DEE6FF
MSDGPMNTRNWAIGVMVIGLSGLVGYSLPRHGDDPGANFRRPAGAVPKAAAQHDALQRRTAEATRPNDAEPGMAGSAAPAAASKAGRTAATLQGASAASSASSGAKAANASFTPPPESAIPDDEFGQMVRTGEAIFHDTQKNAGQFLGNDLQCSNCHIDRGRLAGSAPLWAAYVKYPAYRSKNGHVNTFEERLQGCFRYSMNGKAPPLGDEVLVALESYAYFLAKGAPTGASLPGRGYPALPKPSGLDRKNGAAVYAQNCALCHGGNGEGQKTASGVTVFPPLWGPRSYNWGAGMSTISNAAAFIKANMPLGKGGSLSDKDAWDVAAFIDGKERPQDPRFAGSVAETRKKYHDSKMNLYGTEVDGVMLGEKSPPSGPQPAN